MSYFAMLVVNTGEHCKEQLDGLAMRMREYLEPFFAEKVDLKNEEEIFNSLSNKAIESLTAHMEVKIDNLLSNIAKVNWEKVTDVGDVSEYVRETAVLLNNHIRMVREMLSDTFFFFYLNKNCKYHPNQILKQIFPNQEVN